MANSASPIFDVASLIYNGFNNSLSIDWIPFQKANYSLPSNWRAKLIIDYDCIAIRTDEGTSSYPNYYASKVFYFYDSVSGTSVVSSETIVQKTTGDIKWTLATAGDISPQLIVTPNGTITTTWNICLAARVKCFVTR